MVENAPEGILIETAGRIRYVNPAGLAVFGAQSPDELRDAPLSERLVRDGGSEAALRMVDGTPRDAEVSAVPFVHDEAPGTLVFFEDITESRKAGEAQRRNRALLKAIIEGTPDAVFVKDVTGRYLFANSATAKAVGLPLESILGRDDAAIFAPESARAVVEQDRAILASGKTAVFETETTFQNGEKASYLTAEGPVVDETGEVIGIFGIGRDITDLKRARAEQARLQEQLQQAQKMESIGRLAGGVAHDFNNLLTIINGYGAIVLDEVAHTSPLRPAVAEICKAGERAAALTQQLLAFSRKQVVQYKPLDLNELVADSVRMLGRLVGEHIEIVTRPAPSLGRVMADTGQLHQVLVNLAVNARDAMPRGGRLTLRTENVEAGEPAAHAGAAPGPYVLLRVTDTGTGMDRETRERAFEPFFTTKPKGQGTGLGLSTVYGIIRQTGGWIAIESEPGQGTSFDIYLPRIDAPAAPHQPAAEEAASLTGAETILVVEDQEDVRRLIVEVLEGYGYRVLKASRGDEALEIVRRAARLDLIVTDVVMPGMSGPELGDRVEDLRPGLKLLFISGYPEHTIRDGAAFIAKPFRPADLGAKIRELLDAARFSAERNSGSSS